MQAIAPSKHRRIRPLLQLLFLAGSIACRNAWGDDTKKPEAEFKIPEPYIESPKCSDDLKKSLSSQYGTQYRIIECFKLVKWGLDGIGIAAIPKRFDGVSIAPEAFATVRNAVFQNQTEFLRSTRDPSEFLPGKEPAHASIPRNLFISKITAIGVFMNEPTYIGAATLLPLNMVSSQANEGEYPILRSETLVLVKNQVYTLIQIAQLKGPQTFRFAYTQAEDWARKMNGGRRLATED